jgi:hypothetical protein
MIPYIIIIGMKLQSDLMMKVTSLIFILNSNLIFSFLGYLEYEIVLNRIFSFRNLKQNAFAEIYMCKFFDKYERKFF